MVGFFSERVEGRFILVLKGFLAVLALFHFVRAGRGQFALNPCATWVFDPVMCLFLAFTFLCFFGPYSLWKWRTRVYGNGGRGILFFDRFGLGRRLRAGIFLAFVGEILLFPQAHAISCFFGRAWRSERQFIGLESRNISPKPSFFEVERFSIYRNSAL